MMPRILEVYKQASSVWIRLDMQDFDDIGEAALYTHKEIEALKRDVANCIIHEINRLYPKPKR